MSNQNAGPMEPSQIAAGGPVTPTELSIEKEKLILEKLRLDNEEQRARIAQLKPQWWQSPKAQYAIIIPFCAFVGFLAKNVTQDAVNQAKILKQENQIENQRLEFVQKQLAPRVAQLESAEETLIDNVFRRYTQVCEIAGRFAAAETVADAQTIIEDLDTILTVDEEIAAPISNIKGYLKEPLSEGRNKLDKVWVAKAALSLSNSCRDTFKKKYAEPFPKAVRNLTITIYREAIEVAKDLEESTDRSDATDDIERFMQLYYGKLILVESQAVIDKMITTRGELLGWTQGPPNHTVLKGLKGLIKTLTKEADQLEKQQAEELTARKVVVDPKATSNE